MIDVNMFFDNTPDRVLEHFKNKIPKTLDIDKIRFDAYQRTFIVSAINEINTLEKMHSVLYKAYEKGLSFDSVKNELLNIAGSLGSHHLKTIFNTNMRQAYAMSRYETQLKSDKPYLRYVAVGDYKTRPKHQSFHNLILPKDDPFWKNNYPPNGFNCRCKVQALSENEAKAYGISKKPLLNPAESGFNFNPIQPGNTLFKVLEDKVNSLHSDIRNRAKTIMNNAYRDYASHEEYYKKIKAGYDEFKSQYDEFIKKRLEELGLEKTNESIEKEFKAKIKDITKNLSDREHAFLKIGDLNGVDIFIDKYQIATHLKHHDITPQDYALIDRIVKNGKMIEQNETTSKNPNKTFIYSILGKQYRLILRADKGRFLVDSLIFKS